MTCEPITGWELTGNPVGWAVKLDCAESSQQLGYPIIGIQTKNSKSVYSRDFSLDTSPSLWQVSSAPEVERIDLDEFGVLTVTGRTPGYEDTGERKFFLKWNGSGL